MNKSRFDNSVDNCGSASPRPGCEAVGARPNDSLIGRRLRCVIRAGRLEARRVAARATASLNRGSV